MDGSQDRGWVCACMHTGLLSRSVNTGVHVCLSVLVSLGHMTSSGISGSYGSSIPSFLRNLHMVEFSIVQVSIVAVHTNCVRGSLFSTSSLAFIVYGLFDNGYSDWCEMIPHCDFDLHFSKNE